MVLRSYCFLYLAAFMYYRTYSSKSIQKILVPLSKQNITFLSDRSLSGRPGLSRDYYQSALGGPELVSPYECLVHDRDKEQLLNCGGSDAIIWGETCDLGTSKWTNCGTIKHLAFGKPGVEPKTKFWGSIALDKRDCKNLKDHLNFKKHGEEEDGEKFKNGDWFVTIQFMSEDGASKDHEFTLEYHTDSNSQNHEIALIQGYLFRFRADWWVGGPDSGLAVTDPAQKAIMIGKRKEYGGGNPIKQTRNPDTPSEPSPWEKFLDNLVDFCMIGDWGADNTKVQYEKLPFADRGEWYAAEQPGKFFVYVQEFSIKERKNAGGDVTKGFVGVDAIRKVSTSLTNYKKEHAELLKKRCVDYSKEKELIKNYKK